jgi:hypothetical protein
LLICPRSIKNGSHGVVISNIFPCHEKIEKLKYSISYQKIGDEFFIGGALFAFQRGNEEWKKKNYQKTMRKKNH